MINDDKRCDDVIFKLIDELQKEIKDLKNQNRVLQDSVSQKNSSTVEPLINDTTELWKSISLLKTDDSQIKNQINDLEEKTKIELSHSFSFLKAEQDELSKKIEKLSEQNRTVIEHLKNLSDNYHSLEKRIIDLNPIESTNSIIDEKLKIAIDRIDNIGSTQQAEYSAPKSELLKFQEEIKVLKTYIETESLLKTSEAEGRNKKLTEKIEKEVLPDIKRLKIFKNKLAPEIKELKIEMQKKYSSVRGDCDDILRQITNPDSKNYVQLEKFVELEKEIKNELKGRIHDLRVELKGDIANIDRKIINFSFNHIEPNSRLNVPQSTTEKKENLGKLLDKSNVEGKNNGEIIKGSSGYFCIEIYTREVHLSLDDRILKETPDANINSIIKWFFDLTNKQIGYYNVIKPAQIVWNRSEGRGKLTERGLIYY